MSGEPDITLVTGPAIIVRVNDDASLTVELVGIDYWAAAQTLTVAKEIASTWLEMLPCTLLEDGEVLYERYFDTNPEADDGPD